jgi:hypothetical protein
MFRPGPDRGPGLCCVQGVPARPRLRWDWGIERPRTVGERYDEGWTKVGRRLKEPAGRRFDIPPLQRSLSRPSSARHSSLGLVRVSAAPRSSAWARSSPGPAGSAQPRQGPLRPDRDSRVKSGQSGKRQSRSSPSMVWDEAPAGRAGCLSVSRVSDRAGRPSAHGHQVGTVPMYRGESSLRRRPAGNPTKSRPGGAKRVEPA